MFQLSPNIKDKTQLLISVSGSNTKAFFLDTTFWSNVQQPDWETFLAKWGRDASAEHKAEQMSEMSCFVLSKGNHKGHSHICMLTSWLAICVYSNGESDSLYRQHECNLTEDSVWRFLEVDVLHVSVALPLQLRFQHGGPTLTQRPARTCCRPYTPSQRN